jgi:hypothetical protein
MTRAVPNTAVDRHDRETISWVGERIAARRSVRRGTDGFQQTETGAHSNYLRPCCGPAQVTERDPGFVPVCVWIAESVR